MTVDSRRLVEVIKPSSSLNSLLVSAKSDLLHRVPPKVLRPPLSKISPPDNSVVKLMDAFFIEFSDIIRESSSRAGNTLKVVWDSGVLESGLIGLSNITTFVIIRASEVGEIKVEAEGRAGSELISWVKGSIAIIRDAETIRITGTGKVIGTFVSYELHPAPC
ncbi:hypothetical protein BO86DRAFT_390039 [Aspergillus japonicus CBS 114.51]|uniref:Uncharacterized protein n=1 Tax=Aspergillus japonicus CBS 114.51 TaxID=1448312 RepID=A0A8T8WYI3_ASPJA|nr:hypothetical protein BO86DRAFT_390039 [Aspergillus japonicus CBS 114.51]RAH80875.1 hypothetical protein BO86DRAFT_390039 [Aspergillus japonicus CBS 114.51]